MKIFDTAKRVMAGAVGSPVGLDRQNKERAGAYNKSISHLSL
jgi:hypothetical protein